MEDLKASLESHGKEGAKLQVVELLCYMVLILHFITDIVERVIS